MGYGAFMTVTNQNSQACLITIYDVKCMYDNGDEGSWLSYFNDLTVQPGTSFPDTPNGVYIEAMNTMGCMLVASTFSMDTNIYGSITFTESGDAYSAEAPPAITVTIVNSDDNAKITITILAQQ